MKYVFSYLFHEDVHEDVHETCRWLLHHTMSVLMELLVCSSGFIEAITLWDKKYCESILYRKLQGKFLKRTKNLKQEASERLEFLP